MGNKILLEISVQSAERAAAAQRGGADRIELCAELEIGGITPVAELMREVRESVQIPVFAMIRPRGGDFVYSAAEFAEIKRAIAMARDFGMDGVVLGILTNDKSVDIQRTRELVELARPLPVTFHRAFDECADLQHALEDVIQTGARRILTSGGAPTALAGAAVLSELVTLARSGVVVVPGAGINASNIRQVAQQTQATEFHSGLSSSLPYSSKDYGQFEIGVRNLSNALEKAAKLSAGRAISET